MNEQPMIEHFIELRKRLILCVALFLILFILGFTYSERLFAILLDPLYKLSPQQKVIYTGLSEAFFTYTKLAAWFAILITLPIMLTQIYLFAAPGLYKKEKKIARTLIFFSIFLFYLGALFSYYVVIPLAWKFFVSFQYNGPITINLEARMSEYLSLIIHMSLAFAVAFQLPIVIILLILLNILSTKSLIKRRRIAIFIVFLVATVITPPDVVSQIGLALPLILLYEVSIVIGKMLEKEKNA